MNNSKLIFFIAFFFSCSQENSVKNKSPYKGIKKIEKFEYLMIHDKYDNYDSELQKYGISNFNKDGFLTYFEQKNEDGLILEKTKITYNRNGDKLKEIGYDAGKNYEENYYYDKNDKIFKDERYTDGVLDYYTLYNDDSTGIRTESIYNHNGIMKTKAVFDVDNNLTEMHRFNDDGSMLDLHKETFDVDGNILLRSSYDHNGIVYRKQYKRNILGNIIEIKTNYKSGSKKEIFDYTGGSIRKKLIYVDDLEGTMPIVHNYETNDFGNIIKETIDYYDYINKKDYYTKEKKLYKYDRAGNILQKSTLKIESHLDSLKSDGERFIYEYDSKNNVIKEIRYELDFDFGGIFRPVYKKVTDYTYY